VNKNEPPTIGVDYSTKSLVLKDGTIVKAKIWDTGKTSINGLILLAGSEKYKAITTAYEFSTRITLVTIENPSALCFSTI
jgi:GTPase SAR1 family protein